MIASGNRIFLGMINGYIFKVLFSKLKNLVLKNDKVLNFCLQGIISHQQNPLGEPSLVELFPFVAVAVPEAASVVPGYR